MSHSKCDSYCSHKKSHCQKKIKQNLKVCKDLKVKGDTILDGNLEVKGCITNLQMQINADCAIPPTNEVYRQFLQFPVTSSSAQVLENIIDFEPINPSTIVTGTEVNSAHSSYAIYGYDENQNFDRNGGFSGSHNPNFTEFNLRCHFEKRENIPFIEPEAVELQYRRIISWFAQRGFQIPGKDVYSQYDGQFIMNRDNGQFISIKFVYEPDNPIPIALDMITTASPNIIAMDLYEPDVTKYKNGRYYPIRIPITTNFCGVFQKKYGKEPIVYYSNLHRKITIHVPELDSTGILLASEIQLLPQYEINVDWKDNLLSFDGTFSMMQRDTSTNQLVSAGFAEGVYLVQSSSTITIKSNNIVNGVSNLYEQVQDFYLPGNVYAGFVLSLMNGQSPAFDVYCMNIQVDNAFANLGDPIELPEDFEGGHIAGDNPTSKLIENYASPSYNGYWDDPIVMDSLHKMDSNVLNGLTFPENNSSLPPSSISTPTLIEANQPYTMHEFTHIAQFSAGDPYLFTTGEGCAVAVEMDPKASNNIFTGGLRSRSWTQRLIQITRGVFSLLRTDGSGFTSYGMSPFWRYVATQFDPNYQAMRRMNDILGTDSKYGIGPLLKSINAPFSKNYERLISPNGASLALNKAFDELFGKNIKDVFGDYAVSLAMLRNNISIPDKYKHKFPYWLFSASYPYNNQLGNYPGQAATVQWWDTFTNNSVIPANYGTVFVGQTFIKTLATTQTEKVQDLSMLLFQVPAGTNKVTVNITSGEWRVSLVQFISDGTSVGTFNMDGQHTVLAAGNHVFNIGAPFVNNGSIRLVCAHVGLKDYGGLGNFYQPTSGPYLTGDITITKV